MRTVLASSFTPTLDSGRALRTAGVVSALLAHGPVHLLHVPFGADEPAPELLALEGLTVQEVPVSRGARRALAVLGARLREHMPMTLARAVAPELRDAAIAAAGPDDRVIADGPTVAGTLLGFARQRPCVYLAHNLETSFRGTPTLTRFERRVLETFAESWMCTLADIHGGRELAPDAGALRHVPNVVRMPELPVPAVAGDPRILMLADYRYEPNAEAADWLAREVFPLVAAELPAARLDFAGRGLPAGVARADGVRELGFVDDLAATYAGASVIAVPLLRGGGSPLKFIEALSYARPVVATTHAAALLEGAVAGEHFLAAAEPQAFADALVTVLREGGGDLGRAGRDFVARQLSVEALAEAVAP